MPEQPATEPEVLTLWRAIAQRRDSLVAAVQADEQELAADDVDPRRLPRLQGAVERHRKELRAMDRALRAGTREDSNDRGLTMAQLRDIADPYPSHARKAATAAVLEWLRKPTDFNRWQACTFVSFLLELTADGPVEPLAAERLEALAREARANRGGDSGTRARLASRIVKLATVKLSSVQHGACAVHSVPHT